MGVTGRWRDHKGKVGNTNNIDEWRQNYILLWNYSYYDNSKIIVVCRHEKLAFTENEHTIKVKNKISVRNSFMEANKNKNNIF